MPIVSYLVDTNVLLYAYDRNERQKQARALACLARLWRSESGAVSAQNLGEFWVNAGRLASPVDPAVAERRVRQFCRLFTVLPVDAAVVQEAVRGVQAFQLSYWDAQLWAVAKLRGIPTILTEDLPSPAIVEGVHFINPFDAGFDPAVALA